MTLKVKYADFQVITRSRSSPEPVASREELERVSLALLWPLLPAPKGIRLLGVALSGLPAAAGEDDAQLRLAL